MTIKARACEPLPAGITGCLCPQDLLVGTGLGECVVRGTASGVLEIDRADPVIAVEGRLLLDWHIVTPPGISLECKGGGWPEGDVIRVEAADRRVVYVVTRRVDSEHDVWEAR